MSDLVPFGRPIGWVLSVLVSLLLMMSASGKLTKGEFVLKQFEHLGFPSEVCVPIGVVELTAVILFLVPRTSIFGAVLIAAYMGGACAAHVRIGEPIFVQVLIGVVAWIGYVLRRPDVLRAGMGLPTTQSSF